MKFIFKYMGLNFEFINYDSETETVKAKRINISSTTTMEIPLKSLSLDVQDFLFETFPEDFI